jgi:hypothetical protein
MPPPAAERLEKRGDAVVAHRLRRHVRAMTACW